jgi:hypothetical protein
MYEYIHTCIWNALGFSARECNAMEEATCATMCILKPSAPFCTKDREHGKDD